MSRFYGPIAAVTLLVGLMAAGAGGVSARSPRLSFTSGPLPPDPALNLKRNNDAEPGMAVDGSGTFWIGSNDLFNDARSEVVFSGEDVWKSTNGGRTYKWVASPFGINSSTTGPAGEDSDIAAATAKNSSGNYNVYAVSLWVGSTSVAISQDGGKTWILDPLGGLPVEDRPWIAADGACTFYVTYHQLPTFDPVVNRYDICDLTDLKTGVTIDPTSSTQVFLNNSVPGLTNDFGKIQVDNSAKSHYRHNVYVPMMGCDLNGPVEIVLNDVESTSGCLNKTELFVGVSSDGGSTFKDYKVAEGTNGEQPVWCCNLATDAAGKVYFVWSDNHNAFLSTSSNGGKKWTKPVKINQVGAAVYPTAAGGKSGIVSVAYYHTSRSGDANDAKMGTPGSKNGAKWAVQVATSTNGGRTLRHSTAVPVVHRGILCTKGSGCSVSDSRNLYDDFGNAISPKTGAASIAYSSDQPTGKNSDDFTGYATSKR